MSRMSRLRPSPAMAVACLALFVALAGTSVAAVSLVIPNNSVGTAQLKNNAVTSGKVKDFSLLKTDFKAGQIPAGPQGAPGPAGAPGAAGPKGDKGDPGPGAHWALVKGDSTIISQSGGISMTSHPGSGTYILNFGSVVTGKLIVTSASLAGESTAFRGTVEASPCGGTPESLTVACSAGNDTSHVFVATLGAGDGAGADHAFYIAVIG